MLILSRKQNERILIGNDIEVCVVEIRGDKVRLGIKAPQDTRVDREEVRKRSGQHPEKRRCPNCGYSTKDARDLGDHHKCPQYPYFPHEVSAERKQEKR